jgi:hypothetical protein
MPKDYEISDTRNLVKVSTFARIYKGGVSTVYVYKLRAQGKIDFVTLDEVHFIDLSKLDPEIKKDVDFPDKKNLKK